MTAQKSDVLINCYPHVNLDSLYSYRILRDDPNTNNGWGEDYKFHRKPKKNDAGFSACWRGHISTYQLCENGQLKLIGYCYPISSVASEEFEEVLNGNFWLMMKERFFAPRVYVRFCDGIIDANVKNWLFEEDWLPLGEAFKRSIQYREAHNGKSRKVILKSPDIQANQSFDKWLQEKLLKYPKSPI